MGFAGDAVNENASEKSARRKVWIRWVRIVAGLLILGLICLFVDFHQFTNTLLSVDPFVFGTMLLTAMVGRLLRAWKWNRLLRAQGITISNWQAIRLSLVGHFTGSWTPGQIGGDAYRIYALRDFGKPDVVLSSVLIERYAGLCAVCLFVLVGMPFTLPRLFRESPWIVAIIGAAMVLVGVVVPLLFSRNGLGQVLSRTTGSESPLGAKFTQFSETLERYQEHRSALILFSIATLLEVLSYFFLNWLSARSLGLNANLWFFLLAMPLVHLMLRIPISMQSLGVQEGCFVYAMVVHGFAPAEGLAVSVVQRTLEWIISIAPGGLLLWLTSEPSTESRPAADVETTSPVRASDV